MSKTLAVNAGSSSLKWQLYEMPEEKVIAKGLIERIGLKDSIFTTKFNGEKYEQILDIHNHTQAVKMVLEDMQKLNIIKEFGEITGIGHRVVAGGELFKKSTRLTPEVVKQIEDLSPYAPLHNPAEAACMHAFEEVLPDAVGVAVFDTAFHTTMPAKAYRYPVPNKYYDELKVRKYGAHGTSHMFVSKEAAKLLGKPIEDTKIITCHIGNGASITAVDGGKSVDTSMGFTPLGGIMMGTRSGELDPSILPFIIANDPELKDAQDAIDMLNKKSGLAGISEISSDMRDIRDGRKAGDPKATLAFDMYCDRIKKYIGQYLAVLDGADAIVFTAGIGENAEYMREAVIDGLSWFGIELDHEKNNAHVEGEISTPNSRVKVYVIPTDEELVIARDVEALK